MTIQISPEEMRSALLREQSVERAAKALGMSRRTFFVKMKIHREITRGLRCRRVLVWEEEKTS